MFVDPKVNDSIDVWQEDEDPLANICSSVILTVRSSWVHVDCWSHDPVILGPKTARVTASGELLYQTRKMPFFLFGRQIHSLFSLTRYCLQSLSHTNLHRAFLSAVVSAWDFCSDDADFFQNQKYGTTWPDIKCQEKRIACILSPWLSRKCDRILFCFRRNVLFDSISVIILIFSNFMLCLYIITP